MAPAPSPAREAASDDGVRNAPVIVLTYGNAGGRRLQSLLESQPELTCTTGTGVIAACGQAAVAWKQVDGRPARGLSPMAVKSIRSMGTQMITMITVRTGRPRWCELAAADPAAAGVFLEAFPQARFLCLHRACPDLVSAVLLASPWGLSGPEFAPYVGAYPGSTVAALAAWWAAHARQVLDFEKAHAASCLRLDYADLAEDPDAVLAGVRSFLGLGGPQALPSGSAGGPAQASSGADGDLAADLPLDQIPPPLLAQLNDLHAALGYPSLGPGGTG